MSGYEPMNRGYVKPGNTKQGLPLVLALAATIILAAVAHAAVRIGGAAFSANGQLARDYQYTGSCPVDLKFDWGVIAAEPTRVSYWFRRSDGGHSSTARGIDLPGGNRSVPIVDEWHLGANTRQFSTYHGWVELHMQSPDPVTNRIRFTLHCQ
jgi:hypothetical protein